MIKSSTDKSVKFTWTNQHWTATLDGQPYAKDTWIRAEGTHTIIISNSIGMSATYSFSIDHDYFIRETIPPRKMRKALCVTGRIIGGAGKIAFVGLLLIGNFIMNLVGYLICAITEG